MSELVPLPGIGEIGEMTAEAIDRVRDLERELLKRPQPTLRWQHTLHGGIYTRSFHMPHDTLVTGAMMKVPTTMVVVGDLTIFIGADEPLHLTGYNVVACSARRKVAVWARGDVFVSTYFATRAKTRQEAEREAVGDEILLEGISTENITGE